MALHERVGQPTMTDANYAGRIAQVMVRCLQNTRQALHRCQNMIDTAPGGKAGVVAALEIVAGDASEVVTIMDGLATLANAHIPPGAGTAIPPIVAGDLTPP